MLKTLRTIGLHYFIVLGKRACDFVDTSGILSRRTTSVIMIFVPILLTLAALSVLYFLHYNSRKSVLFRKIPGPAGVPIIGNIYDLWVPIVDLWDVLRRLSTEYYPTFKLGLLHWSIVNIQHPDDLKILLTSTTHISKSAPYFILHPWFKAGLLTSTGSKWHMRRKIVNPAFHSNIMREFIRVFNKEGQRMVRDLKDAEGENEYNLIPLITKFTLNIIWETAMGTPLEDMTEFHIKYRNAVQDMDELIVNRFLSPWLHNSFLFNLSPTGRRQNEAVEIIEEFSTKIIRERQQYHEDTGGMYLNNGADSAIYSESKEHLGVLDLLIAAMKKGDIDEAGIREEIDTFMFAGHHTTSINICFTLLLLAEHKGIQQRARDEVDAVLDKSGGKMTIAEIQQFKYLDRCIKESLRMYPSVPLISRYIGEELPLKKYVLPKGSMAAVHIYDVHRDPNFWPDPHTFDPDRFLPERSVGRHPFSYIPFSTGPRNCIGQKFAILELKGLVAHLLHNFYLEPIDLASKVQLAVNIVMRPIHPLRIRFVPR